MKKTILGSLLLLLLACNNKPAETTDPSVGTAVEDTVDALTRKLEEETATGAFGGDTINFTDGNGLKQGHWVEIKDGVLIKEEWYKDGAVVERPASK